LPIQKLSEARGGVRISFSMDFERAERERRDVKLRDRLPNATGDPAGPNVAKYDDGQAVVGEERD
jgi:hypothetical protein